MKYFILLIFLLIFICNASFANDKKIKIIFSMDQGLGNGPVVNEDFDAVKRMIKAVDPLRKYYDVYFVLNPMVEEKKHEKIMDVLMKEKMPFVLDIIASDSWSFGSLAPSIAQPYDVYHGISIPSKQLEDYKEKYGDYLAGIRFFEVFGADFTIRCCKSDSKETWIDWFRNNYKICEDDFFQPELVEPFLKIAEKNKMFVQWSDFHWADNCLWDDEMKKDEEQLASLMRKYPNLIYACYDNNEPNEESLKRKDDWFNLVNKFSKDKAAGFGLSNQAWIYSDYMSCPISIINEWTETALKNGAELIQFEPVEYFFKFPKSSEKRIEYKKDSEYKDSGTPTDKFEELSKYLIERAK